MATEPSTRLVFSEAKVRSLPIPTKLRQIRYYDTKLPGLCLRVTTGGVRTFGVYRKLNGKPLDRTLGRWPTLSVEQARRLAQAELGKIAAGVDPQAAKKAIREEHTLKDLWDDYLAMHAKKHKRTWAEDQRRFDGYLSTWKTRRLSEITTSNVSKWHAEVGKECGPFAANRAHALLRGMFNFAKKVRGWKGDNPAVGVRRFPEPTRSRWMETEELRIFFEALRAEPELVPQHFFLLALLTGARRANVLAMRWEDIDLKRGLWRIPGEKSKNGTELVVILAPQAVALLVERKRLVGDSPWVLPSPGSKKTGHYTEPHCAWTRLLARAELFRLAAMIAEAEGLSEEQAEQAKHEAEAEVMRVRFEALARRMPKGTDPQAVVLETYRARARKLNLDPAPSSKDGLRIHDLRRTLGSWQATGGSSLPIIGRSLGHKQAQTTAIYARLNLDPVRESVERAASAMLAVEGPSEGDAPR